MMTAQEILCGVREADMPQWRDFLERFRPAGAPGSAGRPGVPADRVSDAAAELVPLLELLDDAQDEAARIRSAAATRAEEVRRTARRQADAIVARARAETERVRAESEAGARSRAAAARSDLRDRTAAEVEELQTRVAERMPGHVNKVVTAARTWLDQSAQRPMGVAEG